jgi:hypothetical protein
MALAAANHYKTLTVKVAEYPVKGSTTIYPGAVVCLNAGYLAPATSATGLKVKGKCVNRAPVDNSAGSDGDLTALVEFTVPRTAVLMTNDAASNNVEQSDVGTDVYAKDDFTVTTDSTGRSVAGEAFKIDADTSKIWVFTPV